MNDYVTTWDGISALVGRCKTTCRKLAKRAQFPLPVMNMKRGGKRFYPALSRAEYERWQRDERIRQPKPPPVVPLQNIGVDDEVYGQLSRLSVERGVPRYRLAGEMLRKQIALETGGAK